MIVSCPLLNRKDFATSCAQQVWAASFIRSKAEGMDRAWQSFRLTDYKAPMVRWLQQVLTHR